MQLRMMASTGTPVPFQSSSISSRKRYSFTVVFRIWMVMAVLGSLAIQAVNAEPLTASPGSPLFLEASTAITVTVLKSEEHELLTLSKLDNYVDSTSLESETTIPGGRSYDGHDWESVHPLLLVSGDLDCSAGISCDFTLPALDNPSTQRYVLQSVVSSTPPSNNEIVSKLLSQATFGPTTASLNGLLSLGSIVNITQWIHTQITSTPLTSHRAHFRRRSNARLRQSSTLMGVGSSCDAHERFNAYAFSYQNRGETLETEVMDEYTILKIHNVPFAKVATADFSVTLTHPLVICEVGEYVGAPLVLGSNVDPDDMMKCMEDHTETIANPAVDFTDASATILETQNRIQNAYLEDLNPPVEGTKLSISFQGDCALAAYGPVFVRAWQYPNFTGTSSYYVRDHQRVVWDDNTLGSSNLQRSNAKGTCTTAKKTFLNEDTCQTQVSECSPPTYTSTELTLDAEGVRNFYTQDGLYAYRISDLRVEEMENEEFRSPCYTGGVKQRWVRLDTENDATTCPDTGLDKPAGLDEAAYNTLKAAIASGVPWWDQGRSIVDIRHYTNCVDVGEVARGASLFVPGHGCYTHIRFLSPCSSQFDSNQKKYRWVRKNYMSDSTNGGCDEETALSQEVKDVLVSAINATLYNNEHPETQIVLDVDHSLTANQGPCNDNVDSASAAGASVTVGDKCWTHSHEDEWQVFEFSPWILLHPGNKEAFHKRKPNPIGKPAESELTDNLEDSVTINYPDWKPMKRWNDEHWRFTSIGRYGDTIDFSTLDPQAQRPGMAEYVGATQSGWSNPGMEVCGSPNEVANEPSRGHQYHTYRQGDQGDISDYFIDQDHSATMSGLNIWLTIGKNAQDQLRQRVAWALSEIFIVSKNDINRESQAEYWTNYYDIFVRHAFGNFHDILKEVAYSPLMGVMLTYESSKSLAWGVEEKDAMLFPDENFAREIMQLFSIGLWKLNQDGTPKRDSGGNKIPTYDNSDITTFARAWTGFEKPETRGNLEADWDLQSWMRNDIDPMWIKTTDTRDTFPKLGLDDGEDGRRYIGDYLQRCDALPSTNTAGAFLRKGAKYRYLGNYGLSELGRADVLYHTWVDHKFALDEDNSELFAALCNEVDGKCNFQSHVVLPENLDCYGSCEAASAPVTGQSCECSIDEPRVVRLDPSDKTGSHLATYYEYIRSECIQMAFPEEGNAVTVSEIYNDGGSMCGDRRLPLASGACKSSDGKMRSLCVFKSERVTLDTAEQRCEAAGQSMSGWDSVGINWSCGTDRQNAWLQKKAGLRFTWTNSSCSIKVQVNGDGQIGIVHVPTHVKPVKKRVGLDTATYFRVLWGGDGLFPSVANDCGPCEVHGTTCLCDTVTSTMRVFDGTTFPTLQEIYSQLRIGASDPAMFDLGTYNICTAPICDTNSGSISIYTRGAQVTTDSDLVLDRETIFRVAAPNGSGEFIFLSNTMSTVSLGGTFSFRNPPMLNSPFDQAPREAYYETDLILDHYFRHSNVAPFIATRLLQLLVTSNPSPRYVNSVAEAFQTGSYSVDSVNFGNQDYGNLAAVVAAIFLDPEARSITLDLDGTHGSAREPLLKLLHYMRSMDLSANQERELNLQSTRDKFGQEIYNSPSVFSFFLPDFQPVGPVIEKGLVSPEAQLFDAPKLIGFVNGITSLAKYGLNDCQWGRGFGHQFSRYILPDHVEGGYHQDCDADLAHYEPDNAVAPITLRWRPSSWDAGFPTVIRDDVTPELSFTSAPYCGCTECTEEMWNTWAANPYNNYTCGSRIWWTHNSPSYPNGTDACSAYSGLDGYFPNVCGPVCDPGRCDLNRTSVEALEVMAASVVSELDFLLTGGRLDSRNRALIEEEYVLYTARRDVDPETAHWRALRQIQTLFALTPEFHITNKLIDSSSSTPEIREPPVIDLPADPDPVSGYKAVVYLFLNGAMDSFNVLVPISDCTPADLHQQYQDVRTDVAIDTNDFLQTMIDVPQDTQPCTKFALHPSLGIIKNLYEQGEAAAIANIGPLVDPITKEDYDAKIKLVPPSLFAHNTQQRVTQTVHAQDSTAGGILGRIGDALNAQESEKVGEKIEIFDAYSISGNPKILEGAPGISKVADVLSGHGVAGLMPTASPFEEHMRQLNENIAVSVFGETFSEKITYSLDRIELLGTTLGETQLENGACAATFNTDIARQFETVAKIIKARDVLEAKRDVFFLQQGGYDTHSDNGGRLLQLLGDVNNGLSCFVPELKAQEIWNNVTVITASEFSRTLTSNGLGTDHAWGGNHFILGGNVNGGRIFGEFPDDLTSDGPLNIGRGRLIPTMPWEAVWHGIAQWMGLTTEEHLQQALPNLNRFERCDMLYDQDLYQDGSIPHSNCNQATPPPSPLPTSPPTSPPSPLPTSPPTPPPSPPPTPPQTPPPSPLPTSPQTPPPSPLSTPSPTPPPPGPGPEISCNTTKITQLVVKSMFKSSSANVNINTLCQVLKNLVNGICPVTDSCCSVTQKECKLRFSTRRHMQEDNTLIVDHEYAVNQTTENSYTSSVVTDVQEAYQNDSALGDAISGSDELSGLTSQGSSASIPIDFEYEIAFQGNQTAVQMNDAAQNEELVFHYNISDKPAKVTLYKSDCNELAPSALELLPIDRVDGTPIATHDDATVKINLRQDLIPDGANGVWTYDSSINEGEISFCMRMDLYATSAMTSSVNFDEVKVTIKINMESGFEVTTIGTNRDEAAEVKKNATVDYELDAYQCIENGGNLVQSSAAMSQGSTLGICVDLGDVEGVSLAGIQTLTLTQGSGSTASPVLDGTPNSLTDINCDFNDRKQCFVKTMVISKFFDLAAGNSNIAVEGMAVLAFGRRRKLATNFFSSDRLDNKEDQIYEVSKSAVSTDLRDLQDDYQAESSSEEYFRLIVELQEAGKNIPIDNTKESTTKGNGPTSTFLLVFTVIVTLAVTGMIILLVLKKKGYRKTEDECCEDLVMKNQKATII